ncbi:MFS transporter [Pseudoxanthobacter sp.]|uniref:MFS transporter n=1 Tax=Pseudoxanthobacter sp. TaxID=1925742 RepID=UPI002FE11142
MSDRVSRLAVSGQFIAGGVGIGTWGANLPALSARAGLNEGDLGLVLLCFAAGAIISMINAPRVIRRFTASRAATAAGLLFGGAIALAAVGHTMALLAVIALLAGTVFGALDVTINAQAADLERRRGEPMMATFHGLFSAGGLLAAAGCGYLLRAGADVMVCLPAGGGAVALVIVAMACVSSRPAADEPAAHRAGTGPAAARVMPSRGRVVMLGVLAFLAMFAEGACFDWVAIYLVRVVGTTESVAAFGFAVFAGAMATGRLCGDYARRKFRAVVLLRAGAATVAVALTLALLGRDVPAIFIALAVAGLGMANIIPIVFSVAGRFDGRDGGRALSRVLTMGYTGILVGPAFIGFMAHATTLTISLSAIVLAMVFIGAGGHVVDDTQPASPGVPARQKGGPDGR